MLVMVDSLWTRFLSSFCRPTLGLERALHTASAKREGFRVKLTTIFVGLGVGVLVVAGVMVVLVSLVVVLVLVAVVVFLLLRWTMGSSSQTLHVRHICVR